MSRRTLRVNELLRDELSLLLQRKVEDPRLRHIITVTEVSVSKDLNQAKVFFSVMGSEEDKQQVYKGLHAAAPFLRRSLASRLSLRHMPHLAFYRDDSLEKGARLFELMNQASPSNQDNDTPQQP